MRRSALLACALLAALAAAAFASLIPPGESARREHTPTPSLHMPAALANGSRRDEDVVLRFPTRVTVSPAPARVGQRLTWRGSVLVPKGTTLRFDRPRSAGEYTWGDVRTGRTSVRSNRWMTFYSNADSVWIESSLQVFATGPVAIPGPAFELRRPEQPRQVSHLPTARVIVLPTVTAADTNAQLRALHGPVRAPWWERVPWRWVAAAMLAMAALLALVRWLFRRKPAPATAPVAARPVVARDPGIEALAELRALRALLLPEEGRFADHAFALTRILRRYLEAVVGTPRPGDTSAELVARLRQSRLVPEDVARLEGLLGLWDRVKFARAPLEVAEAHRCEDAVESLVRARVTREVA